MRIGKAGWTLAVMLLVGIGWLVVVRGQAISGFATSSRDHGVYFRLLAKYQHGDEIVDFDIVAGCAVNVTRYGDGGSSYDTSLDPRIFAKATQDGGAIWQIVPSACLRETTTNGKVPKDFLPGAVWFDSAEDFSFGVAYVTEDAFENPKSKLKFLGASIIAATREEWEGFQSKAKENLVNPKQFGSTVYHPTPEEIAANLWDKKVLVGWVPTSKCYLVERYELLDTAAITAIREKRPTFNPQFWTLSDQELKELTPRVFPRHGVESLYFHLGTYQAKAFPTRARGGMLYSDGSGDSSLPPEIYPIKMGDGLPWLTPGLAIADPIYSEVDLENGANRGFAYCYSTLRWPGEIRDAHLPDYHKRNFATKVDGLPIAGEFEVSPHYVDGPRFFFEGDNAYYLRTTFGF